jgi:hypothetical protein
MKSIILSSALFVLMTGTISAINCKRSIQIVSGKEVHVEITIHKDKTNGFARLAEFIPDGAEIKYAKTEGGTFDIQGKRLKFIWISMPQKDEFTVSYTVSTEGLKEGNYSIYGKFNYVDGDDTKEVEIASSSFDIKANTAFVASGKISSTVPVSAAAVNKTAAPAPSLASAAPAKVTYGLQLLTTKEKLASDYFAKKYSVKENVMVDVQNGLNKYIFSGFKSTADALAYRDELAKKGCKDSFLVAYYNNKRITMDEAKNLEGK